MKAEVGSITRAKGIASFEAIKDRARRKKEREAEVLVKLVFLVTESYCR